MDEIPHHFMICPTPKEFVMIGVPGDARFHTCTTVLLRLRYQDDGALNPKPPSLGLRASNAKS